MGFPRIARAPLAGRSRWIPLCAVLAVAAAAQLGLVLAQPVNAGDPQTFFRVEYTASYQAPDLFAAPAYPVEARLHRSEGPSDRGSLSVGVVRGDGTFGPYSLTLGAAQGVDVVVGQAYTGLALLDDPATDPAAPAASCAGMDLTIDAMTLAPDGSVATLAVHASCPSMSQSYEARVASDVPFAAYETTWLQYGAPYPGAAETQAITVTSTGTGPLVMSDIAVADLEWGSHPAATPSLEFSVPDESCTTAPVEPGGSCTIDLQYRPLTLDALHPARVTARVNTAGGRFWTYASGGAQDPIGTPGGHDFGTQMESVPSAPHRFTFTVAGGGPRTFGPVVIDGDNATDYQITGDTCTPAPVQGGTTCAIDIAFSPTHVGASRARLLVHGDSIVEWRSAVLAGSGVSPISVPTKLEFGYQPPGGRYTRTVTLTSLASAPLSFAPFTHDDYWMYRNPQHLDIDSETCTGAPVPPLGSCTITFVFTPDAAAPPDTWSERMFSVVGDGWDARASIFVTGIARVPDTGGVTNPPPVITVDPFNPSVTEGDYVQVTGTYADPRGLAVTMTGGANAGGQGWGVNPTGIWAWQGWMPDGPGTFDLVLTASDGDATSPPTQLHFTIANAPPTGTVSGPRLVPVTGEQRIYQVRVSDPGRDIASVTPTCGSGTVVSFTLNQSLICSFAAEGAGQVGVIAVDTAGARKDVVMPVTATSQVRAHANVDISIDTAGTGTAGVAVALVDLDGDGSKEVVAGTGSLPGPTSVTVLLDTPTPRMTLAAQATPPHGYTVTGPAGASSFGRVLASAGDVNCDGVEDLLIGAPDAGAGSVWVIYGGRPAADLHLDTLDPSVGFRIDGQRIGSALGTSLAGGGDVNGDGYGDIVLGAPGDPGPYYAWSYGAAYVVFGGPSPTSISLADPPAGRWAALTMAGENDHLLYGSGLAIGDIDRDGLADVISGGALYNEAVFITWGSKSFTSHEMGVGSSPAWTRLAAGRPAEQGLESSAVGHRLAIADVNGDGVPDIVAGYMYSNTTLATIFFGSGNRVLTRQGYVISLADPVHDNIVAAGDMDGDGHADIVVRGTDVRGYTAVAGGGQATGTVRVDSTALGWLRVDDSGTSNPSPLAEPGLGDVNGDGLADLVLRDSQSIDIVLGTRDRLAPVVGTPTVALAAGTVMSRSAVPLRVAWAASDPKSGVRDFTVSVRQDGGTSRTVAVTPSRTISATAMPGHRYQWLIRARDWAGNTSAKVPSVDVPVVIVPETSTSIHWIGPWSRRTDTHFLDGHSRAATAKGSSATLSFRGRSIGWVATRGPGGGSATVYLDGVKAGMVSLYGTSGYRRIVFAHTWASAGTHTIRIVVAGTQGHARVDVDGFVVLR